jgi:hypothetical protein
VKEAFDLLRPKTNQVQLADVRTFVLVLLGLKEPVAKSSNVSKLNIDKTCRSSNMPTPQQTKKSPKKKQPLTATAQASPFIFSPPNHASPQYKR